MRKIRIALLCYTYEESDEQNREKVSRLLKKVEDADFVLLPEDSLDPDCRHPEKIPGEATRWLQEKARAHSVNIIGNLTERSGASLFNTCVIIDRKGQLVGSCRKVQLSYMDKSLRKLTPGKDLPLFKLEGIPFGVSICYDAWYPETVRNMVLNGAKLVFVPFREERPYISYIRKLASARAIENVIPLVGCGGGGYSRRFDRSFKNYAYFALPSGKIIKEETRRELSVHTFPPLDALIKRERSRMNWERPFDRNIKFNSEQND